MAPCERCDYDLAGIAVGGSMTICPECGHAQYAQHAEVGAALSRMEIIWRLVRHAVAWCLACAVVTVLGCALPEAGELFEGVLLCLCVGAVAAGFYGAIGESWTIAVTTQAPGRRRRRAHLRLAGLGFVLNAMVGAAFVVLGAFLVFLLMPFD